MKKRCIRFSKVSFFAAMMCLSSGMSLSAASEVVDIKQVLMSDKVVSGGTLDSVPGPGLLGFARLSKRKAQRCPADRVY
jgi:hypothetical protein